MVGRWWGMHCKNGCVKSTCDTAPNSCWCTECMLKQHLQGCWRVVSTLQLNSTRRLRVHLSSTSAVEVVLTHLSIVCNTWCMLFLGLTFNTRRVLSRTWNNTYRMLIWWVKQLAPCVDIKFWDNTHCGLNSTSRTTRAASWNSELDNKYHVITPTTRSVC